MTNKMEDNNRLFVVGIVIIDLLAVVVVLFVGVGTISTRAMPIDYG